ncbi:MAG: hypothetical protein V3V20_06455 [Algisphaera sp.]
MNSTRFEPTPRHAHWHRNKNTHKKEAATYVAASFLFNHQMLNSHDFTQAIQGV